ncbi:signal peptidase I [Enterococcus termitis]|nr:signal peptidase I [Enterococcus termitis]OJG96347.1 signal peptidase I [Enterococcus termitis]
MKKGKFKRADSEKIWKEMGSTIIILFTILLVIQLFVFSIEKNKGYAMREKLKTGEYVLVNHLAKPVRFSVIFFKLPNSKEKSMMRIVGMPGERIKYVDNELYINDQLVSEPFLSLKAITNYKEESVITENFDSKEILGTNNGIIPKGKYLVLGDNRNYATDSRYFGVIDECLLIGTVIKIEE